MVLARQEPVARPLKDGQALDARRDLGDELNGAGAGSDDGDALSCEPVVVVPVRRVEAVPRELVQALDARDRRLVQLSRCEDQGGGRIGRARGGRHRPAAALIVPRAGRDRGVGLDQAVDAVGARHGAQVVVDLALARAQPRPVAALRIGERVEVARDVAGGARIAVVEPGSAELGRLLEDPHVADPVIAQLDGGRDPAEARTHDEHVQAGLRGGLVRRGCGGHGACSPEQSPMFRSSTLGARAPACIGARGTMCCRPQPGSASPSHVIAAGTSLGSMLCPASDSW